MPVSLRGKRKITSCDEIEFSLDEIENNVIPDSSTLSSETLSSDARRILEVHSISVSTAETVAPSDELDAGYGGIIYDLAAMDVEAIKSGPRKRRGRRKFYASSVSHRQISSLYSCSDSFARMSL